MNKVLISVVGPTAIGKTKLAILLAKYYHTEILSADSRQFFQEMRIGTAVPSIEELNQAPHHFIQHKSIIDHYTVGDFEREAIQKLDVLFKQHNIVIMVGGSGLYVNAVTKGLHSFPKTKPGVRDQLNAILNQDGLPLLQDKLQKLDPDYYATVDINNPQRVIRALEVSISGGKPYSSYLLLPKPKRNFKLITIGLIAERLKIYQNIDLRVDQMIKQGLLEETKALIEHQKRNALQTVGYKELFGYLNGVYDFEYAVSEIKKNTRRFAKRQLTWFKKEKNTLWVETPYTINDVIKRADQKLNTFK